MFLTQAVANNGFPFEIKRVENHPYAPLSEERLLEKLESSKVSASQGKYRFTNVVIVDLREKHGLKSSSDRRCRGRFKFIYQIFDYSEEKRAGSQKCFG